MNSVLKFFIFRACKVYLIGGSIPETSEGKLYNTSTG